MPCFGLAQGNPAAQICHYHVGIKIAYGSNAVRVLAALIPKSTLSVDKTKIARSLGDDLGMPAPTSAQSNPKFAGANQTIGLRVSDFRRGTRKTEQTDPIVDEWAVVVPQKELDKYAPAEMLLANTSPSFLADKFRFYQAQVRGSTSYVIDCHGRLQCISGTAP